MIQVLWSFITPDNNMKIVLLIFFIFLSGKIYSQIDSSLSSKEIYSLKYADSDQKLREEKDIRIISLDPDSIKFLDYEYNTTSRRNEDILYAKSISSIKSFGYKVGAGTWTRIKSGALIGFGAGFLIGLVNDKKISLEPSSQSASFFERIGLGLVLGIAASIPGGLIGAITGIGSKEYEEINISKYDNAKKYIMIKDLIKKGSVINKE